MRLIKKGTIYYFKGKFVKGNQNNFFLNCKSFFTFIAKIFLGDFIHQKEILRKSIQYLRLITPQKHYRQNQKRIITKTILLPMSRNLDILEFRKVFYSLGKLIQDKGLLMLIFILIEIYV